LKVNKYVFLFFLFYFLFLFFIFFPIFIEAIKKKKNEKVDLYIIKINTIIINKQIISFTNNVIIKLNITILFITTPIKLIIYNNINFFY